MLSVCLTRRMPNKLLFGIRSSSPQSRMPRSHSHTDVDIPLYSMHHEITHLQKQDMFKI